MAYPTDLDDDTSMPTRSTGDTIPATDSNTKKVAIIALEGKLGTGATTPTSTNKILRGTGTGTTAWGTAADAGLSATGHAHAASDVTSGLLASGRIATGTPDGSKFLRDDQVWTAIPGGGDALTTSPLSQFAATTSAQLRGVLSDETGTGAAVFANSPALVTPTGIVKGDVGLGNVDNTSDATKDAASATLTNKTLTSPVINTGISGTAIVDEDDMTSNSATKVPTQQSVKAYVDSLALNMGKRARVRAATTANITIATALNNADTLDSVTLATGDLVLVKNQTASEENGVYVVGVSPARSTEFDTFNEHPGSQVSVAEGTANADTLWLCTTNEGGALGTDPIAFSKLVIAGELLAANNLSDVASASTALTNLGLTATATELNYTDGVTSAIQTQLDAKQASGATLTSLEGLTLNAGDILYATAADTLVDLPIGTANQELRVNAGATAPEWYTPSAGGGQTVVTKTVAASGGDYTTLTAAIAAASAGWHIKILPGTYTETGFTSTLANLTIEGSGIGTTILQFSTNNVTLSGAKLTLKNFNADHSTGSFTCSGDDASIVDFYYTKSSTGSGLIASGLRPSMVNVRVISTSTTTGAGYKTLSVTNDGGMLNNVYVKTSDLNSTTTAGVIGITGNEILVSNSRFELNGANGFSLIQSLGKCRFSNCHFIDVAATGSASYLLNTTGMVIVTGSQFLSNTNTCIKTGSSGSLQAVGNFFNGKFAIEVTNATDQLIIEGNNFQGQNSGTAIKLANQTHDGALIIGNNFYTQSIGVSILGSNAKGVTIAHNFFLSNVTTPISESGTATQIYDNTGSGFSGPNFEKKFLRMKNTSGSTIAAGAVVVLKNVAAGDEITTTTTASDNLVFGVAEESITNTSYGYVQVSGKTVRLKVDGTTDIAIGDFLTTFTTAEIARKAAVGTLGTTPGDLAFAIALEAYATNDSSGVIDALLIVPRRL